MEKFIRVEGIAAPFVRQNVDTDTIIPIIRLVEGGREGLGRWLFESLRYDGDGNENPDFILNREPYREASILLAGPNFGCGSSREGAVTALYSFGIRCVIAPSFGEIFFNNCFKNALLPIILAEKKVRTLAGQAEKEGAKTMTVDLEACALTAPDGTSYAFEVDGAKREKLLQGLDDITATLRLEDDIAAFQQRDREKRPWVYDWSAK